MQTAAPRQHGGTASNRSGLWYWLSVVAFAMAMLSKGSAATLPPILLLIVWWLHGRVTKQDVLDSLPFFAIALLLSVVINAWYQMHGNPLPNAPLFNRVAGAGGTIWFYLCKSLLPISVLFLYPQWQIQMGDLRWWIPSVSALLVTVTLIIECRRPGTSWARPLLFAWLFYCFALGPVMGIAESEGMKIALVADHYQHLALIAVVTFVAAGFSYLQSRRQAVIRRLRAVRGRRPRRSHRAGLATKLVVWKSAASLRGYACGNHDALARTFLHYNVGILLSQQDHSQEAEEHYQAALKLMPEIRLR